ncbi:hypothetical protein EVG20_g5167 [Dentipellis fragilis]|uniref:SGT1-domain-containing protein n=1 Tax=Dentipellis fragilis TaxID=205917 RepID=A0A4Y9YVZ8_9AGAM|nr:hypothetical protein EVG20_g5167 [Dentipellis fragilis]
MDSLSMDQIFNRPPSISEDTLQYTIYPPPSDADRSSVTTLAVAIQSLVESVTVGFVWHRDAFELKVVHDAELDIWKLEGRMRVGDSVDDEWFTVWLLREVTARWDAAVSVYDSDGEFMLIEAAESLPSWVTPSNSENRVWIYKSRLHLIPLSHISPPSSQKSRRVLPGGQESDNEGDPSKDDSEGFLSVQDALKLLRDPVVDMTAPSSVEKAVWQRISGYPETLKQHTHTAKAVIPVDIAKALAADPSLVQRAVETFYTRDAGQLRAAQKMSRFPPEPSVLRPVKMTRTAYAQLAGQKFHPPKVFGRWQERENSPEWRWRDIGMKIACGFEMLYQESKGRTEGANATLDSIKSSADARRDALRRDPEYVKYIQSLHSAGYFQGEIEGSQLWNELEAKAVNIFIQTRQEDNATRQTFASLVNAAILQAPPDATQSSSAPEDSDEWLNIDAQDFDSVLEKKMGTSKNAAPVATQDTAMDVDGVATTSADDQVAKDQAERLKSLAKKVGNFLEGKGDIEGARFEDEQSSDEAMSEFSEEKFSDSESDSGDEDDKMVDDGKAARQEAMDKLVPALDPFEYGKMPASFHSNSQRVARLTVDADVVGENTEQAMDDKPEDAAPQKPIRAPILMRNKYEGVDSDDETDEELDEVEDEDEEDHPQVVGDVEIDMEEEQEEFLEFARDALGISNDQWADILHDRKSRGAFVPSHVASESRPSKASSNADAQPKDREPRLRQPMPGPRPNANPDLDSFESVMQAMDAELARSRSEKKKNTKPSPASAAGKGKGKAEEPAQDIESAMDAELLASLDRGDDDEDVDLNAEEGLDYNLIKNFLESYKSQGGLSGPVSSLAGMLQPGSSLPRDDS